MRRLLLALALATTLAAQPAPHSAIISWSTPADATTGTTYEVWRLNTACPGQAGAQTLGWSQIATGLTATTYTDTNLAVGKTYCWMVTQRQNGVRSYPSNLIGLTLLPNSPTITIQQGD